MSCSIPSGLYSLPEHLEVSRQNPENCDLVVNMVFSLAAGMVSFWLPGSIMVYVYVKVTRSVRTLMFSKTVISPLGI